MRSRSKSGARAHTLEARPAEQHETRSQPNRFVGNSVPARRRPDSQVVVGAPVVVVGALVVVGASAVVGAAVVVGSAEFWPS
jgi:UDP-3-O-[3-hydroxymyristoyl] glucosamine N-acyltransferase